MWHKSLKFGISPHQVRVGRVPGASNKPLNGINDIKHLEKKQVSWELLGGQGGMRDWTVERKGSCGKKS